MSGVSSMSVYSYAITLLCTYQTRNIALFKYTNDTFSHVGPLSHQDSEPAGIVTKTAQCVDIDVHVYNACTCTCSW